MPVYIRVVWSDSLDEHWKWKFPSYEKLAQNVPFYPFPQRGDMIRAQSNLYGCQLTRLQSKMATPAKFSWPSARPVCIPIISHVLWSLLTNLLFEALAPKGIYTVGQHRVPSSGIVSSTLIKDGRMEFVLGTLYAVFESLVP